MTEKTLTTENIKPALDALRGELAPWPVVAKKQDRLNTAQLNAANSGITSSLVAQIIANTAAIRALESAITGTGLRALVVASLPAVGTTGILYIVPVTTYDPTTDADVVNYSNEYIWIPVEAGQASEGHYEQVGQTGIVINNGQLTITVNGTSVGTFTANQSGDTTAAITVPTNADYVDRTTDQTVAGVKTFSSTINGTASKAIADEDGTSIKNGYVNVAGNQTVTGQKIWTQAQVFQNNIYLANTSYTVGAIPTSNITSTCFFSGASNYQIGYCRSVVYKTTGQTSAELTARNKFANGALDPNGDYTNATLTVNLDADGTRWIQFANSSIKNGLTPYATDTYNIGSATNQWLRLFAKFYYYNGIQWGLDQANTWTGYNTFTNYITSQESAPIPAGGYGKGIAFRDYQNNRFGYIQPSLTSDSEKRLLIGVDSGDIASNSNIIPNANNSVNLGKSGNQWSSVYAQTYYYNGTAWGLDKANTWTGANTFKSSNTNLALQSTTSELGSLTAASNWFRWIDKNGAQNAYISRDVWSDGADSLRLAIVGKRANGAPSTSGTEIDCGVRLNLEADGTKSFTPFDNNINLGTSTNKWKSLNGVNPGALSLPDFTSETGVSLSAGANTYTPVLSGWLSISTTGDISVVCGNFCHKATDMISVPVIAGKTYTVTMPSAATGYFYSCLGNV